MRKQYQELKRKKKNSNNIIFVRILWVIEGPRDRIRISFVGPNNFCQMLGSLDTDRLSNLLYFECYCL